MFYGTLTLAESESGVRKILKSLKKVMGQKLIGTQTLPAHNLPRLKWIPNMLYIFDIQGTCYNIGHSNPFRTQI